MSTKYAVMSQIKRLSCVYHVRFVLSEYLERPAVVTARNRIYVVCRLYDIFFSVYFLDNDLFFSINTCFIYLLYIWLQPSFFQFFDYFMKAFFVSFRFFQIFTL